MNWKQYELVNTSWKHVSIKLQATRPDPPNSLVNIVPVFLDILLKHGPHGPKPMAAGGSLLTLVFGVLNMVVAAAW